MAAAAISAMPSSDIASGNGAVTQSVIPNISQVPPPTLTDVTEPVYATIAGVSPVFPGFDKPSRTLSIL